MRLSFVSTAISLLLLLSVPAVLAKNNKNENLSHSRKPSFIHAWSSIPRGGDNSGVSFRQQLDQYEQSMKQFLGHYEGASTHMKEVLEKTLAFHTRTNHAMSELEQALFKVSVQLSMLPSELSTHFQILHKQMVTLQEAATTMLDQLVVYVDLVMRCSQLVEGLVSEVQTKSSELPSVKKQERRYQRNAGGTKYTKLQQRVQEEMMYLQETSISVREEVLEIDTRAREDVWPAFLEKVQSVHEAAVNVDRSFQAIREGRGSNASTNSTESMPSPEASTTPGQDTMDYNDVVDGVQEVEVEMTTYQVSW